MAYTLDADFVEAVLRAGPKITWLVELTDGTWSYKFTKGSTTLGYEEAVLQVEPVAAEYDPFTRKPKGSAVKLTFDDRKLRPVVANVQLKHQQAIIKIGAPELIEGDYTTVFTGPMEEILPHGGKQFVDIEVEDVFTVLQKTMIVGYWNDHPLAVIHDILLNKVGLPAGLIDANSLDPTQYADIGHLIVCRGVGLTDFQIDTGVREPTSAFELIDELCRLLNGQLIPDEDGKLSFKQFNAAASAVEHWDSDVIIPGSFEQLTDEGKIVNRITCQLGRGVDGKYRQEYEANDTASQAAQAYPGMADRVLSLDPPIKTDWLDYIGTLQVALAGGAGDLTASIAAPMFAWSGSRKAPGVAQPVNADCHADRPVYLMLTGPNQGPEIVKATAIAFTSAGGGTGSTAYYAMNPEDGQRDSIGTYHTHGQYTIARGQLGTTRQVWGADYANCAIFDVTALVLLSDELLARFVEEMHIVRLQTSFKTFAVLPGDFVTLDYDEFLAYGLDGISSAKKWEVLRKEINDEETVISYTLGFAGTNAITRTGAGKGISLGTVTDMFDRNLAEDGNVVASIVSGFLFTDDGGLNATIGAGTAAVSGMGQRFPASTGSRAFNANKVTYVYWDARAQAVGYREEAGAITYLAHETPLRKVTTDGADITAEADLRVSSAIGGVRVHAETLGTRQTIADNWGRNFNSDYNQFSRGSGFEPDGWSVD